MGASVKLAAFPIPEPLRERMEANGRATVQEMGTEREPDHMPVIRVECGGAVWLLSEIIPDPDGDYSGTVAFGLCDLGMGFPELGTVFLEELAEIGARIVEGWTAGGTLTEYAGASKHGITEP